MATWIVSGGGDALDNALNRRNGYAYRNGDTILVKPGTYSPVNFAQYFQNISVIGEEGKENTIIDAGGMNGGNIVAISAGICNPCLLNRYSNSNYIFNFYGISLRNGFISTDLSTDALIGSGIGYRAAGATGSVRLYDCGIYDCSCYSHFNTGYANIGNKRINAIACTNGSLQRCEISGNHGNTEMIGAGTPYYCDIHNNYWEHSNAGDHAMINVDIYISKFHHNYLSGIGFVSHMIVGSLFYRNQCNGSVWLNERCFAANCTFAYNTGINSLDNNFGGRTYYKNCAFYQNFKNSTTRAGANWGSSSPGTIHVNNYFDQLSTTMVYYTPMTSAHVSGNVWQNNADFGFVDPENDDYHLRPDSILISAGSTFQMGADNQYESNSWSRSRLSSLDNSLRSGDIERKPWDAEHPSVGAYQYQPPAQNIPNKIYPLGRNSVRSGMIYDAELTYLSGPGYANFQLPMSVYDYRTSFEIKSSCGHLSGVQSRWGFDVTQSNSRYQVGLWNHGWDALWLGGYEAPPSNKTSYQSNQVYTYSFDADNLSGKIILSNGTVNTFTTSLRSGYSATWRATNINYSFFGMSGTYWRNPSIFYYAKFWNSDGMIADVIPVRVGNVGCLFDKVKGQMLTKYPLGTRIQFIKGPDKA